MSPESAARIAFVGAGNHATQSLYPCFTQLPNVELVAVCDRVPEKAQYAARKYGAPRWYTEVGAMLAEARPAAVGVCGPAEMHYEVGLQVLRAGLPLFLEKPPALTVAQTAELVRAARDAGVFGMVGFMKRFAPANLVAKSAMAAPEFGAFTSLSMIHSAGPYDDLRRMLLFNGIHMLDLARFLGGEIAEVSAFTHRQKAVFVAAVNFRFASGAVGQFNMNSGQSWRDCFEQTYLTGSGAALLLDASRETQLISPTCHFGAPAGQELFGWSSRYYVSGNMAGWAAGGHYTRGYWGELDHFAKAVLGQVEPQATLEDGLQAMRFVDAILESAAAGATVRLDAPAAR